MTAPKPKVVPPVFTEDTDPKTKYIVNVGWSTPEAVLHRRKTAAIEEKLRTAVILRQDDLYTT
jgi:hypothetical protein